MSQSFDRGQCRTLSALVLAAGLVAPHVSRADEGTIRATSYLREGPAIAYRTIDEVAGGVSVQVIACANEWCRIQLGDATGYVASAALNRAPPPTMSPDARQACFLNPISGYHGTRDEEFCSPASR